MALPIKKFREIVLQILFCHDFESGTEEELLPFLMKELRVTKKGVREAYQLAQAIHQKRAQYDAMIEKFSLEYGLERIPRAERNIMRIALFELYDKGETPPHAAISEAIRLTRKFATRDSARYVNAVLDAIYKNEETTTPSALC